MAVQFRIERFEGPLDLLLQLVEQEKLDISEISLATVADQFVNHIQATSDIPLEELADFLVVAAKLVYIKSRLMLPDMHDDELEEGPDLESQLRMYRAFVEASKVVDAMWKSDRQSFVRGKRPIRLQEVSFSPPSNATATMLEEIMRRVIARIEPIAALASAAVERVVTVQEKIREMYAKIGSQMKLSFHTFIGKAAKKIEAVASFLALLELVKQKFVRVNQGNSFADISIEAHPDAPEGDPFLESS